MDKHKETIIQEMKARGVKKLPVGNRTITLTERKGSRSLSWDAVAAAGVDLSAYTKIGKPSVSLSIT